MNSINIKFTFPLSTNYDPICDGDDAVSAGDDAVAESGDAISDNGGAVVDSGGAVVANNFALMACFNSLVLLITESLSVSGGLLRFLSYCIRVKWGQKIELLRNISMEVGWIYCISKISQNIKEYISKFSPVAPISFINLQSCWYIAIPCSCCSFEKRYATTWVIAQ